MKINNIMDKLSMFEPLGKIAWLWMNSPLHREWPVELCAKFLLTPIQLGQYLLIERNGMPVAYCSWAFFSQEDELNYLKNPSDMSLSGWQGGGNLWFIDWVAPFSRMDSFEMRSQLKAKFDQSVARAIRVKKDRSKARVMEFKGARVPHQSARSQLDRLYFEFLCNVKKQQGNMDVK